LAVQVSQDVEDKIFASVKAFGSQAQIIEHMVVMRAPNRIRDGKGLELYLGLNPRPKLDYEPYHTHMLRFLRD
jgi:hypothetical protein